jgi:acyl-coenzyme A thioesterase PaaI-like protein
VDETGLHLELKAGRTLRNPLGIMHGGVSLCASEYAAILALKDTPGPALTTASVHMIYARPIAGGADVRFAATVLRRSRGMAVVDVTGYSGGKASTFARITAQPVASRGAI